MLILLQALEAENRSQNSSQNRSQCHHALYRQLSRHLSDRMIIVDQGVRSWASSHFVGARHYFVCRYFVRRAHAKNQKNEISALHQLLFDAEWHLDGHIVADVALEPEKNQMSHRTTEQTATQNKKQAMIVPNDMLLRIELLCVAQ